MTTSRILLSLILILTITMPVATTAQHLRVSDNGRYLVGQDGSPFLYLADTGWQMFLRLDHKEARYYLQNRADKGFTVIQAVVPGLKNMLDVPNANGDLPFIGKDVRQPNEAYFRHVDDLLSIAEELGLVLGILPTWGIHWKKGLFTPETGRQYGEFLGSRYKGRSVIWILGGDQNVETDADRAMVTAIAEGLEAGDGGTILKTYHPIGPGQSSDFFHHADWLDFNMNQSSHSSRDHDNGAFTDHDYALSPPKPTVDGEPRYECLAVGFYFENFNRYDRFDAYDVRQAAWWSILAGACGHTYGNNNVWQMWEPDRVPNIFADIPWSAALDHPGAFQIGLLGRLLQSRPWHLLEPCQQMIVNGPLQGGSKIRAALAADCSFAVIYSPCGEPFTLRQSMVGTRRIKVIWFDPRYGSVYHVQNGPNTGFQTYSPPTSGRGNDWVLILEDAGKKWPLPKATGAGGYR